MEEALSVVLGDKPQDLVTVNPDDTVYKAVEMMNDKRVGAVLVTVNGKLQGIFTERDVLMKIIGVDKQAKTVLVKDVMTTSVQTVPPNMRVAGAMKLMTEKRFRHLPVVDGDQLLGMISIGDLTKWVSQYQEIKIRDLENYILG